MKIKSTKDLCLKIMAAVIFTVGVVLSFTLFRDAFFLEYNPIAKAWRLAYFFIALLATTLVSYILFFVRR